LKAVKVCLSIVFCNFSELQQFLCNSYYLNLKV